MKQIAAILILAVLSFGFLPTMAVAAPSAKSDARAARKMNKKQQKAQKKYMKAQKKAQKKMFKKDVKNTHLPSQY